jgi:hypothetical protein
MNSSMIIGVQPSFGYNPNTPLSNVADITERKEGTVFSYTVIQPPNTTEDTRIDKMQRTANEIDQM